MTESENEEHDAKVKRQKRCKWEKEKNNQWHLTYFLRIKLECIECQWCKKQDVYNPLPLPTKYADLMLDIKMMSNAAAICFDEN